MRKLFKILKLIPIFFYKNVYLIMILATIYAAIRHDYLILIHIGVLALISIAIELRCLNNSQTTKGFDNMMYDISQSLKKIILSPLHKKQKKCDLYSDTSKCPDKNNGLDCNKCDYFN